jgi:CRISPR/Cas system CSM-associated protein Csm3 (group 7 of RAMP superfamily)
MLATIDLPFTINLKGPLHVGTGYARGLLDRTVVQGRLWDEIENRWRQQVYMPGSSLKGHLRHICERLAWHYRVPVCRAPRPSYMCHPWKPCLVCRVFGSPGRGSGLTFDDAHLTSEWSELIRSGLNAQETRTQVQLSRRRNVTTEGRLFTAEYAVEDLSFETRIAGRLALTPVLDEPGRYYEIILLLGGLRMLRMLGGGSSRGVGHCEVDLPIPVSVTSAEYGTEKIDVNATLEHLEFLDLYADQMESQEVQDDRS